MRHIVSVTIAAAVAATVAVAASGNGDHQPQKVQLGPRPFFLVDDMKDSPLKRKLERCSEGPFKPTTFSIGHRGAALQFPEHTKESYEAAARIGGRHRGMRRHIHEGSQAGVSPRQVWPQSFNLNDVLYWINHEPAFGRQAVYLDDAETVADLPSFSDLVGYKQMGVNVWAPPTFALLDVDVTNAIVPSEAARNAKAAGLDIITWTLERSGILADGNNGFYYQTIDQAIRRDGDLMRVIDVLARQVGILGVFSDWPAAVTYYANCMGIR